MAHARPTFAGESHSATDADSLVASPIVTHTIRLNLTSPNNVFILFDNTEAFIYSESNLFYMIG
jgi:hypothetical protein